MSLNYFTEIDGFLSEGQLEQDVTGSTLYGCSSRGMSAAAAEMSAVAVVAASFVIAVHALVAQLRSLIFTAHYSAFVFSVAFFVSQREAAMKAPFGSTH